MTNIEINFIIDRKFLFYKNTRILHYFLIIYNSKNLVKYLYSNHVKRSRKKLLHCFAFEFLKLLYWISHCLIKNTCKSLQSAVSLSGCSTDIFYNYRFPEGSRAKCSKDKYYVHITIIFRNKTRSAFSRLNLNMTCMSALLRFIQTNFRK